MILSIVSNGSLSLLFFEYVVLCLTGFLLIEQLMITDGTVAPLNRLRTIYAFAAAIALFAFGVGAAIVASRWYSAAPYNTYQHSKMTRFLFDTFEINSCHVFIFYRRCYCLSDCFCWHGGVHSRSIGTKSQESHHLNYVYLW